MIEILHSSMPEDILPGRKLPGVQPAGEVRWIDVDEAYAGQLAYRRKLIAEKRELVLSDTRVSAQDAIKETFQHALLLMPSLGFEIDGGRIYCPDGYEIDSADDSLLAVLGQTLQEDVCILTKDGDEHILAAAILCFPAGWKLSDKIGLPLSQIHIPVAEYTNDIARRVQRMFDGVQVGRPLWRNNFLRYYNPDLFQPKPESAPARDIPPLGQEPYLRAERQTIFRLPQTKAVVFSIHSYVVRSQNSL